MSRKTFVGVLIMAALLVLYLWAALYQGIVMLASGDVVVGIMGAALIVLPLIGGWALYRELQFGFYSEKLMTILVEEGPLPGDDLDRRPSGRPLRAQADEEFAEYAKDTESQPESWRAWMRLGIAYDNAGDRKRARHAVRTAIALFRKAP